MRSDDKVQRWTEPTALPPLNIKPHPYCGQQCDYCRQEFYPDGSPRFDRGGNALPPQAAATEPQPDGTPSDAEPK